MSDFDSKFSDVARTPQTFTVETPHDVPILGLVQRALNHASIPRSVASQFAANLSEIASHTDDYTLRAFLNTLHWTPLFAGPLTPPKIARTIDSVIHSGAIQSFNREIILQYLSKTASPSQASPNLHQSARLVDAIFQLTELDHDFYSAVKSNGSSLLRSASLLAAAFRVIETQFEVVTSKSQSELFLDNLAPLFDLDQPSIIPSLIPSFDLLSHVEGASTFPIPPNNFSNHRLRYEQDLFQHLHDFELDIVVRVALAADAILERKDSNLLKSLSKQQLAWAKALSSASQKCDAFLAGLIPFHSLNSWTNFLVDNIVDFASERQISRKEALSYASLALHLVNFCRYGARDPLVANDNTVDAYSNLENALQQIAFNAVTQDRHTSNDDFKELSWTSDHRLEVVARMARLFNFQSGGPRRIYPFDEDEILQVIEKIEKIDVAKGAFAKLLPLLSRADFTNASALNDCSPSALLSLLFVAERAFSGEIGRSHDSSDSSPVQVDFRDVRRWLDDNDVSSYHRRRCLEQMLDARCASSDTTFGDIGVGASICYAMKNPQNQSLTDSDVGSLIVRIELRTTSELDALLQLMDEPATIGNRQMYDLLSARVSELVANPS